jgi:hypothetical protein
MSTRSKGAAVAALLGALGVGGVGGLGGCDSIPREALALTPQSLQQRQLQTRRFQTTDEARILQASAGLLQDVGFTMDSTNSSVGLLCASKDREAVEAGQVVGAVVVFILFGASMPIDTAQKIRVSVLTLPSGNEVAVRVTFQRIVWNSRGYVSRLEMLDDPKMYQEFFEKLSKAIFLEGHSI